MFGKYSSRYWFSQLLGWTLLHAFLSMQSVQAIASGQESIARVLILSPLTWFITVAGSHVLYLWSIRQQVSSKNFRNYWPGLLQMLVSISLAEALLYWLLQQAVSFYLPPPLTRSALLEGLFDSFLLFILNFALVNMLLLSGWWACLLLFMQKTVPAAVAQSASGQDLAADSPVMISDGRISRLITPGHIEYAFSEGNYVKLVGTELNMLIRSTLSHLEQRLSRASFFRANRQTLVNLRKVKAISEAMSGNYLLILESGKEIEASRRQGLLLKNLLSL